MSTRKEIPSREEIFNFMDSESRPYKFEYVREMQPIRVSADRRVIYVNEEFLIKVISKLVRVGLDWKQIMRKNIKHEKAHERYLKWNLRWGVNATEYGWLASYLTDIVIDKIHFANDEDYQNWLHLDSRHVYKDTARELYKRFPTLCSRPHFLYNQAAYWVSIEAITLVEAVDLYPEKACYIMEMSQLFNMIKSEEDLKMAYSKALRIYLASFGDARSQN